MENVKKDKYKMLLNTLAYYSTMHLKHRKPQYPSENPTDKLLHLSLSFPLWTIGRVDDSISASLCIYCFLKHVRLSSIFGPVSSHLRHNIVYDAMLVRLRPLSGYIPRPRTLGLSG